MIALLSCDFSDEFEKLTGIKTYPLKPYSKLDLPVSSHADMLLCVIEKKVFCYKDYYLENLDAFNALKEHGYSLVFVSKECSCKYPNDIALNVLVIGKRIVCNIKHTAMEIIDFAKELNYEIINVKQGYSACSCAVLDEKIIITSDKGIARELQKRGIIAYFVDNSQIVLSGYNCGFIGGASCVYDNKLIIFGKIHNFKDKSIIETAVKQSKKELICLQKEQIIDFGGAKLFSKAEN